VVRPDKVVYIWFGRDLFEVLQLKRSASDPIDAEKVLAELIGFQTASSSWRGLATVGNAADGEEEG